MEYQRNPAPFLGAAYYPEDWDDGEQPGDIAKMQEAGLKAVRIGEFAWRKMEPKEGSFHFTWLHEVVDRLKEAGISVILGTPTATPPIWFLRKHPDAAVMNSAGIRTSHGGRRHCCSNNEAYREASASIIRAMAQEFGRDENVIGWQLDNEIYMPGDGCFCPTCVEKFHRFLEKKYGTIDALNARWNLNLFSQAYDCFDEIPAPANAWHNPHILLEWKLFQQESCISFLQMQQKIVREYTDAPIGTDMMPFAGLDYEKMNAPMDLVMFNHYNSEENLWEAGFWFDYLRGIKEMPFWNTETQTGWNASVSVGQVMKPEGFCRVNSWMPVAFGGEANLYWLWRQHWAGHELMHGSVLSAAGRPLHMFGEIRQTAEELEKAGDFLRGTRVFTEIAMHFTSLNWNLFECQPWIDGFRYYDRLASDFYRPLTQMGVRVDIIGAQKSLEGYKVLISPYMMTLEDDTLPERIERWVKDGGIWIAGPMTDQRTGIGTHYTDRAMGMLERLTGAQLAFSAPDRGRYIRAEWKDGTPFTGSLWFEMYDASQENTLVTITGMHSAVKGKSLVMSFPVGRGRIILLGTIPSAQDLVRILKPALEEAGVKLPRITGELSVSPRSGAAGSGLILVETGNKPASVDLEEPMTELLTGKSYLGHTELEPYSILVLKK